jgi:hypothetical protein
MVDLDTSFRQELFKIPIRQAVAEVPTHRQHDHLRWKPEPDERRQMASRRCGLATTFHLGTLADSP